MATLRVTSLRGRTSGTSPELPDGAVVTGVTTTGTLAVSVTIIYWHLLLLLVLLLPTPRVLMLVLVLSLPHHLLEHYYWFSNHNRWCSKSVTLGNVNAGVVTATSYEGSGALLTGLPAGFTELDAALFN